MNDNSIEKVSLKLVASFNKALVEDGLASKSIESYTGDIRGFIDWLESKGNIFTGKLTRFHCTAYKNFLVQNNYEINTINKKINSLQSFNQFLIDEKYLTEQVVNLKKDKLKLAAGSEKEVEVFTDVEVEELLFFIHSEGATSRLRLIIVLLLYTGLRVSELVNIKLKDIDLLAMNLTISCGKGSKRREIPLKGEVIEAIKEYLEGERRSNKFAESEFLILTNRAARMDRDAVNKLLNKLGMSLGLKMYPHLFRHTFCTNLLRKKVELTTVAKLAGHASIQTTANFYINTSQKDKKEAVDLL
ncbi:tyrosine-type recombinase/integrase [Clostridium bowmanii]|uniref:tyrosine-type recombinase/integrase n=1 Tax=Clostridium bowmanii TaxID=132925 RepID=UPI001C0C31E4|nr:tyrosine-type recombinase/integrase [Clostridium bowmanii]MBU3190298.1 tyrosine-type recombinase/integrase [Clostridium bowmanii]MCA1072490.1 tyrosine-type recombinase/integrase [Clostridium bowmanii]